MTEATYSTEMFISIQINIWRHIPEDSGVYGTTYV